MAGTTTGEPAIFNPFEPGFFEDPYAQYAELREHDPVHRSPLEVWVLFRYDDIVGVLRDSSLSVQVDNATPTARMQMFAEQAPTEERERGAHSILNVDPPDHTRLRRLVSKAFTPKMVHELRPRIQALVDEALDTMAARGESDVISDLAFPLPFTVISEMLGMPDGNRDEVRGWSHTLTKTLDPILSPEEVQAALTAADNMQAHVQDVLAWKRDHPADDLLTGLLAAEDEGDRLSEMELLDQVLLLYVAGHETTVNLIGNATLALLGHPDQLAQLRSDPELDGGAVEELLRYDSPVQFSRRITTADLDVAGTTIPGRHLHAHVPRLRQPRRSPVGADGRRARHHPTGRRPAHVVRQRDPPLPRLFAGPDRGPGGDRHARAAVPRPRAGGRARAERPRRAARARVTPGDARILIGVRRGRRWLA